MSAFTLRRGTNISHWLSQSKRRGAERRAFFTAVDVKRIADYGMDHLRLPIDEEQMWTEAGAPDAEAFDLLDQALDWARAQGLRAIVDLHIVRSHYFNQESQPALFTDPAEAAKFAGLWEQLSDRLRSRSVDDVAYELLNEPVARDPEDWNRVAAGAHAALRRREPGRTIVLGSNWFQMCDSFDRLAVPAGDPRLILSFHFYLPMLLTHYTAKWWREGGFYDGPVQYPGTPIPLDHFSRLDPDTALKLAPHNRPYSADAMLADIAKPLAVARKTGLPLHCGEFGVYQPAPRDARLAWYRDFVGVLEQHRIAWSNWDYKGNFGLVDNDGRDTGIAAGMLAAVRA